MMFRKKRASLELSVNAIVIIVLAITMLGLGLGFLRGMFGKSLNQVEDQLKGLEQQRIDALKEDCDTGLCLESTKIDIKRNEQKDMWMVLYNKFDCDISTVTIKVAGTAGGTTSPTTCQMISTDGSACSDISIQSIATKTLPQKTKEAVLLRVKAKSGAKTTVYNYDIEVSGQCNSAAEFKLNEKMTLTVNVEG